MVRIFLPIWAALLAAFLSLGFYGSALAQSSEPLPEIMEMWRNSGHGDATSPAFTHWNDDGEIPQSCATCHSGIGFLDFHGLDESTAGTVDQPAPVGSLVDCQTCHDGGVKSIEAITFPSGISVADIGSNATCMTCHQGRQSSVGINNIIADLAEDDVNPELAFINSHYKMAAATLLGTEVKGGYEYEGKTYMGRFAHVPAFSQCSDCHNPHTLEVRESECTACHKNNGPETIRTSTLDFDGDGDVTEAVSTEISAMHRILGAAITAYADQVTGAPLVYDDHQYPYFFNDSNADGAGDPGETIYPNKYASWTPRLLKAAYNFQFIAKDEGAYAHNPHYAVQILYDSIESLSEVADVEMPEMVRP